MERERNRSRDRSRSRERRRYRDRSRDRNDKGKYDDARSTDRRRKDSRSPTRRHEREKSHRDQSHDDKDQSSYHIIRDERPQKHTSTRQQEQPQWGKTEIVETSEQNADNVAPAPEPKVQPNFGLSGALAKDERTGNTVNGIVLKFTEPFEASKPDKNWRLYVYRGEELTDTMHIHRRSCFLIGRDDRIADIVTQHPSCSLQHAVIQFRAIEKKVVEDGERVTKTFVKPYIMDLQSTHGTFLNGERLDDSRYYELLEGDILKFGGSTREYVLLHSMSGKE